MESPKVGCCSWILTTQEHGVSNEAIKTIGKLGFKAVELIVSQDYISPKKDLSEYYTPRRIEEIVELCRENDLTISQFAIYSALIEGLVSLRKEEKNESIQVFRQGVEVAKQLGTKIVSTVAHWPIGLETPMDYAPRYIYPLLAGRKNFLFKLTIKLPSDFVWNRIWENYVDSIAKCADIASDEGLQFSLEPHTYTILSNTDAFLSLFREVQSENLGMNMDTGWLFMTREYLPMSILKIGKRLFNMHIRDSDGVLCYDLPAGSGIIDWEAVVRMLKVIGFKGFMDFETKAATDTEKHIEVGRKYLEGIINDVYGT